MSDAILTFQVQLSGVMETVLKSAMYEITQLVENSFLEEVARSKQEVESLKQRLQWSESRRREREGGGRVRCADCGRAGVPCEETENTHSGADESRGLKQEKVLEGAWSSCPGETSNVGPPSTPQEPATPSPITAPDMSSQMPIDMEGVRNESLLKEEEEETEKESTEDDMQGAVELSALGEIVSGQQWSPDMSEDTAPPAGHILPEQLSTRLSVGETGGLYMPESEHEHTARRVRLAGTPHRARLRNDLVLEHDVRKGIFQAGSDFTHENTDSEGLSAQPRMQPDSDCSSSSRALEPKPVTVYLDAVPIKQEVDSQADWDGDEEVYVPHRPLREVRGGRAPQPSAVTDHTSSRDLASCHGEFSEAECVTSQPRPQGRGSLVNHTQIRVTDSGATAAHSTAASHKGVCSLNSKAFMASKSIQGHPRAFPGERRLGSPHFGKSVTQLINVRSHLRQNMERTPHSCTQCGKTFSHLCHLKAHQQTHTGERPFCCTLCGRSFTKLSNLKAHRRVHTGERPYICTECGKRFTQKCNLKRHQRIHTAERLFSCK